MCESEYSITCHFAEFPLCETLKDDCILKIYHWKFFLASVFNKSVINAYKVISRAVPKKGINLLAEYALTFETLCMY